MPDTTRLDATPEALRLLALLRERHGEILLHQSGGCCDGSVPMCYLASEFQVGDHDVLLGSPAEVDFWVGGEQFRVWKDWFVTLDARPGRAGGFSLEGTEEMRFVSTVRPLDRSGRVAPSPLACEVAESRAASPGSVA